MLADYYALAEPEALAAPFQVDAVRDLVGGVAKLRGWIEYKVRPNLVVITARPQRAVRLLRLRIGQADRWRIHAVRHGGNTIFDKDPAPRGGDFCQNFDFGSLLTPTGMDVAFTVQYVGDVAGGEQFSAALFCEVPDRPGTREILPVTSSSRIPALDNGYRILVAFDDDRVVRFEERDDRLDRIALATKAEFEAARTRLAVLRRETAIGIDGHCEHALDHVATVHVCEIGTGGLAIFGVDEANDRVVFEILGGVRSFKARCRTTGFVPEWFVAAC